MTAITTESEANLCAIVKESAVAIHSMWIAQDTLDLNGSARQVRVTGQHALEDLRSGRRVRPGTVGTAVIAAAVVSHRSGQVTTLTLVVQVQDVDDGAAFEQELPPGTTELSGQERQIEAANAEAGKITILKEVEHTVGHVGEGWLVRNVSVADTVDRGCGRRDRHARIEAMEQRGRLAGWCVTEHGQFNDPVVLRGEAGSLGVEDCQWSVETKVR
jgi:hypothetical protein